MAISVIGGLITSTLLTLVIVPAVFTLFDDVERWAGPRAARLLSGASADVEQEAPQLTAEQGKLVRPNHPEPAR
jgi:hypothetical protein